MDHGDIFLRIALFAAVGSAALALNGLRGRKVPLAASVLFGIEAGALVAALGLLALNFLTHRFEYSYVAEYSSRSLSPALTFAAVWAGQQGSILLWATLAAVVGLALLRQPGSLGKPALVFFNLSQVFFLVMMVIKSPFERSAMIPADGMGLNPLLEDPWMVIHPPVLFLGYAALVVPFSLAAAALVKNDLRDFSRMVWPWALFAVLTLGLGIGLGGVWAYKTLGWGGYWGWDPVENASLIPWLISIALLHGLLIHKTTQALMRTNLLMAVLAFLTVVGGTYLTRSGVLSDFSVHSFQDMGLNTPLIAFLALHVAIGAGLLAWRWRAIPSVSASWLSLSRESALWLGLMTVAVLAALVTLGTTAPILTALTGRPSNVSTEYYTLISIPVGIAIVLLMAVSPALRWRRQQGMSWVSALAPGLVAGLLLPLVTLLAGLRDPGALVLTAVCGVALGVNAASTVQLFRRGWTYGAGYLGHVGIAVMVLGMVLSATLGRSERLQLERGKPVKALGYTLTYTGSEAGPRGDQRLAVEVAKGNWRFDAKPVLVPMREGEGMMRKPSIDARRDLYLSPIELHRTAGAEDGMVWLTKNEETSIGGVAVKFTSFRMESHEAMEVYADLEVTDGGQVFPVAPGLRAGPGGMQPLDAQAPRIGAIRIGRIDADRGRVGLVVPAAALASETALVEFSTKPFVNLVWIGALLALVGSGLAGWRRATERAVARVRNEKAAPAAPALESPPGLAAPGV